MQTSGTVAVDAAEEVEQKPFWPRDVVALRADESQMMTVVDAGRYGNMIFCEWETENGETESGWFKASTLKMVCRPPSNRKPNKRITIAEGPAYMARQ
jgi:hypothetical protein